MLLFPSETELVSDSTKTSLRQIGIPAPFEFPTMAVTQRKRDSKIIEPIPISIKQYDSLIGELRCPSCAKPMQSPVKLCETGHSICNLCTKMLSKCPLCTKAFTQIRSLTLEAVIAKAEFYCSNAAHGCRARLPFKLLNWHEKRCVYQVGACFMGKIWGNCSWSGCEIDWIDHCTAEHIEKVYFTETATIEWSSAIEKSQNPICAYYIFRVFGETFNLYQIWDKTMRQVSWTMICASKDGNISKRFGYEIELFSPSDPFRLQIQRHACHGEMDDDVLQDGHCPHFDVGDVMRFMDGFRVLHYRVKIISMNNTNTTTTTTASTTSSRLAIKDAKNRYFDLDYNQTEIDGSNLKCIPKEFIITRKTRSNDSDRSSIVSTTTNDDGDDVSAQSGSSYEHVANNHSTIVADVIEKENLQRLIDVVTTVVNTETTTASVHEQLTNGSNHSTLSRVNPIPKQPRQNVSQK